MSNKRTTNNDLAIKLEVLIERVHNLQEDLGEIKKIVPRVKSLELFRSYVKGCSAMIIALSGAIFASIKGAFGHF